MSYGPPRPMPRPPVDPAPTLDRSAAARDFLRLWSAASVAEHNRQFAIAAVRFTAAAMVAPQEADCTTALTRAFACQERAHGRYRPCVGDRA